MTDMTDMTDKVVKCKKCEQHFMYTKKAVKYPFCYTQYSEVEGKINSSDLKLDAVDFVGLKIKNKIN